MTSFAVEGSDLKAMIKIARKRPVSFAFNPGKSDAEHYLGMHRKKAAALLGKDAKNEGPGMKVAFGAAEVDGKCLNLTCERVLPALAKRIKKYLKSQKVLLNVQVMDENGTLLESDIEEGIPDDPSLQDDEPDAAADAAEAAAAPDAAPELDARAVAARITAERDRMKTLPEDQQQRLLKPLQAIIGLLKGGDIAKAAAGTDKIAAAIDQMLGAAQPAAEPAAAPGGDLQALAKRLKELRDQFGQIADPDILAKLTKALKTATETLRAKQLDLAASQIDKIEKALKSLGVGADAAAPQAADDPAARAREETGIAQGTVKKRAFLMTRWQKIPGELKAEIAKLQASMALDVPEEDPDSLTASIQSSLDDFCEEMQDALDEAINAGDPGYSKSVKLIGEFKKRVQSDKLIQHIKNNPFDGGADVEPVLMSALDEMQQTLSA